MQNYFGFLIRVVCPCVLFVCAVALGTSCKTVQSAGEAQLPKSCAIALAAQSGNTKLDEEITKWQQKSKTSNKEAGKISLEQLGWKFIEKARISNDPGFYQIAAACAECIQAQAPQPSPEAMLLRGHSLHQMHRFTEAEPLARELVKARGLAFDFGLLGDVLMEQGKLKEAIEAYQKMMDQKPNAQAYSRAAHIRWLQGDVTGAEALATMAARAGSPQDREATAWSYSRLAFYELQQGKMNQAKAALGAALQWQPEYAPALLLKGKILMGEGNFAEAVPTLKRAAELNPLTDYQWSLSEALRASGNENEAQIIEAKISQDDPRTLSLFYATRNINQAKALSLGIEELKLRQDVYTWDALAWANFSAGNLSEAGVSINQALAENTPEARFFLHAGIIKARLGNHQSAEKFFHQATVIQQMLLPSEREYLKKEVVSLQQKKKSKV
jgi:tetratricopeptide (TPR) repeat protein